MVRALFAQHTAPEPNTGCWIWLGSLDSKGYGTLKWGPWCTAYQVAYVLAKGPVPVGKELHHTCRNRWCVNPDHLVPLTREEHVQQPLVLRKRVVAKCGHPFDSVRWKYKNGKRLQPFRSCSICFRVYRTRWIANKRKAQKVAS
jgi:hypothetical protein